MICIERVVVVTVCVKVALTHYLVFSRKAVPSRFAIEILMQAQRHFETLSHNINNGAEPRFLISWCIVHCMCGCLWHKLCALYVWLSAWKSRKLLFRTKPRAIKIVQTKLPFPFMMAPIIISTQDLGWNFREMFTSYTPRFLISCYALYVCCLCIVCMVDCFPFMISTQDLR